MKILIASDIHGSYYYLEKLINIYKKGNFDKLLLLGDILYHGARNDLPMDYNTKKCFSLLNEFKDQIIAIKGNCDSEVDEMVLDFPLKVEQTLFIDGKTWICCHGHHLKEKYPLDSIVLFGHTHIKKDEIKEGTRYLNPGSISIPKDGTHSYIAYENQTFSFCILE